MCIRDRFGIGYDVKAELEARITAVVAGMEDQKQIATTAFTLTTCLLYTSGRLLYDLETLIAQGLSAAVYTQTTDVEGEVNGLITYDRKVYSLYDTGPK